MLSIDELVALLSKYKQNVDRDLLEKAYNYAQNKHINQKRVTGDDYFIHPLAVAKILIDMRLDESTIAVALLHDTIEDTSATKSEVVDLFGEEIANLVDGLTKLNKLDLMYRKAIQVANLRKLLLAMTTDIRVLLVKLADRLDNMRTLDAMPRHKRHRISRETLDIYAPLASRMGMQDIKEELENLAFMHINKDAYDTIKSRLDQSLQDNNRLLEDIAEELKKLFVEYGIKGDITWRIKKPYSVFHKMETKGLKFEELTDIFGFRIFVDDVLDCYKVLGVLHIRWSMVPGKFKDYVSIPKSNDYQSIHTTVVSPSGHRVEIQIRTKYMDKVAEYGVAAYSTYKSGDAYEELCLSNNEVSAWLKRTLDLLAEGNGPDEFLEHTKLELLQDQVICFTPKGQLITLPVSATVLDFAYAVHTEVGDHCVGSRVNGINAPISQELVNGDEVEILCDHAANPNMSYENFVKTGRAKIAIRRATRAAAHKKYCVIGLVKLENYFQLHGQKFSKEDLNDIYKKFSYNDIDSMLVSIGRSELAVAEVFKAIFPDGVHKHNKGRIKKALSSIPTFANPFKSTKQSGYFDGSDFLIYGRDGDAKITLSEKGVVPGDKIVGILDKQSNTVKIYPAESKIAKRYSRSSDVIEVVWADNIVRKRYKSYIAIMVSNQLGALASIINLLFQKDVNILDILIVSLDDNFGKIEIALGVWNIEQLRYVISKIKELSVVSKAYRLYD